VTRLEPTSEGRVRLRRYVAHGPGAQPGFQIPGTDQMTLLYEVSDIAAVIADGRRVGGGHRPAGAPRQKHQVVGLLPYLQVLRYSGQV